jgi:heptosyltransferase-3
MVPRYLIICTLRLGDVLLTTPLARSIKDHEPEALVDYLVLSGTEGILSGNPDIHRVWSVPHRTGLLNRIDEWRQLYRRYDFVLAPVSSDRARFYAFISGKQSIGFYNPHSSYWSKSLLTKAFLFDDINTHTVLHHARLLEPLGIPKILEVVPPQGETYEIHQTGPRVVIHPWAKFTYKNWRQDHWIALIKKFNETGWRVHLTGSNAPDEATALTELSALTGAVNLAGQLSFAQITSLLRQSNIFVGVDTSITHLAAATGIPTWALFGPTNPVKWGPWPANYRQTQNPWQAQGTQTQGNVTLMQGPGPCVPCHQEGCLRHPNSHSQCLDDLTWEVVWTSIQKTLGSLE